MIARIASPAVGVAAVVFVLGLSLATSFGPLTGLVLLALLATAGVVLARTRARSSGQPRAAVVERVG